MKIKEHNAQRKFEEVIGIKGQIMGKHRKTKEHQGKQRKSRMSEGLEGILRLFWLYFLEYFRRMKDLRPGT